MRTLCPLYTWSGDTATWKRRIDALNAGDAAVVVGENSGPGHVVDPKLVEHIAELRAKNVTVLGYVSLDYGERGMGLALNDIVWAWAGIYGVKTFFFDEWPTAWSNRHLGHLWGAVRCYSGSGSPDKPIMVINPGVPVTLSTPPKGVLVVTHEGADMPTWIPQPWEVALIHDAPTHYEENLSLLGWQWGYSTPDGGSNPYDE